MKAIDLFAGAGGFSTGAAMAGVSVIWAANHWPAAVQVHANNHPNTLHVCQDLQQADWTQVPAHDLLMASPACQGHSRARGKEKAHHDAQRSTAWAVVDALECHRPRLGVVENVEDFAKWVLFPAWCAAITALGYAVSPHLIDSADHGVPQHRVRLYIVLTRSKNPLELTLPRRPHAAASSVIDFGAGKWSLLANRVQKTRARACNGRARHGDRFVMPYYGKGSGLTGRSLERPIGTITTKARWGVVDGDRMRMVTVDENRAFMGFPVGYKLPPRVHDANTMLGNAVVPVVACDVINALRAAA
ncbi:DNA cytosine methyltransferase [Rhodoferax sp. GW822-FHT02A01]|uniref:DNA cytosine methyltransferase n=1 Tax=Rhodoferax sp. GW822-FHT02A01 TaxID=3141537 RepID=UPI00315C6129